VGTLVTDGEWFARIASGCWWPASTCAQPAFIRELLTKRLLGAPLS